MANQPTARPWFRLASIARPAPPPAPAPAPAQTPDAQPPAINPLQRPSLMRPAFTTSFRPPNQPQEPAQPAPPPPVSAPPPPPPPVSAPPPPQPAAATTAVTTSVPSSPIINKPIAPNASSLPPSPGSKGSPSSTRIPVTSSSSVPPSPKPKILAPTASSVPNSPIPKILATNSPQQPKSPAPKISSPISSEPNSPAPKFSAPISSVSTSPAPKISSPPLSLKTNSPSPKFTATNSSLQPNFSSPKAAAPTSSSVPNSPTPKAPISAATTTITARLPTPSPSLKFTKQPLAQSPPQSPKINSYAPPPSPLVLPPSMLKPEGENGHRFPLEAEQKTVLVQKTIEKPKPTWFNGGDSQNNVHKPSNFHSETYEKGSHNKKNSDSEESGMRVITIAGENRGAFMELSHSHRKHGHFLGNPHSLMEKNGSESDSSSDNKGKSKITDKNHKKMATASPPSPPMNAYMNSNVQGINNSIVFNSSHTHHDPGVHLSLSRKPNGDHKMFQFKDNGHGHGHGHHS